jgi:hypothetical protein
MSPYRRRGARTRAAQVHLFARMCIVWLTGTREGVRETGRQVGSRSLPASADRSAFAEIQRRARDQPSLFGSLDMDIERRQNDH